MRAGREAFSRAGGRGKIMRTGAPTAAPNSLLDTLAGWQPNAGTSFQHTYSLPDTTPK